MKRKKDFSEQVRIRALKIIERDNMSEALRKRYGRSWAIREMQKTYLMNIEDGRIGLDDVVSFCREYGCTADYLLGLSDKPYVLGG